MSVPAGWITPDWPVPPNVRAVCTTRGGGVSAAPYDSLNLGDHVGDEPSSVRSNRMCLRAAIGARPVFLRQVHGTRTVRLLADTTDGTEADGCVTILPGAACTMMVADCLPVLFATRDGTAVAAAHAGWRGLAGHGGQGILQSVCDSLLRETASRSGDVLAWLGPCIGPQAFEVGPEVKAAFESLHAGAASLFKPLASGKWLADLPGLARMQLRSLGLTRIYGNDGRAEWCTVTNPSRFFSHRRDRVSGRLAASVWLA